jgi:hypothetical protein
MDIDNIPRVRSLTNEHEKIERMLEFFRPDEEVGSIILQVETSFGYKSGIEWQGDDEVVPEIKKMLEQRKLAIEKQLETL